MTRPQVTFLVPHLRPSGGIRHILEVAAGVRALGWPVRVLDVGRRPSGPESLAAWWPGLPRSGVSLEHGGIRSLRPASGEVVVTYGDAENEMFLASHFSEAVLVLFVLDWLAFQPARQLSYIHQGTWDAVACSSPFLRERLAGEGISAWEVGAGVSPEEFSPGPRPSCPDPVIGCVKADGANKGWDDAVRAAGRASSALRRPVRLACYGDAAPPAPGLPDGVSVEYDRAPSPAERLRIVRSADVWLCPSRSEGFGFPSLEAMACGVPVVTYDNGGWTAFLRDRENGVVVPPGDFRALGDAAAEVLSSPALHARLSAAALAESRRHTWDACSARFADMLRAVLEGR